MIAACCRDGLAVAAIAAHANEAAVVVVLAAAAANIEARLLRETATSAIESGRGAGTSSERRVGAEHGDTGAVL